MTKKKKEKKRKNSSSKLHHNLKWDLTSTPCHHTILAIYISKIYATIIHPISDKKMWFKTGLVPLTFVFRKQPNKPKRMRRRQLDVMAHPNSLHKLKGSMQL